MLKKILVIVKTYPNPSSKYQETVCTAGIDEEGKWVRLYPVRYRQRAKDQQYSKWDWIQIDVVRNQADFRPESHKLVDLDQDIQVVDSITANNWLQKRELLLNNVQTSLEYVIQEAKDERYRTSLVVFKPKEITGVFFRPMGSHWTDSEIAKMAQMDIFADNTKNPLRKLPFLFGYKFKDTYGKESAMTVFDWEIGALYFNCFAKNNDEKVSCLQVIEKLHWLNQQRDLHFILGTTLDNHRRNATNPFTIVGLFYPPMPGDQTEIEFD